jgi:P4 family phage/plasmid primase-like protien
MSFAAGLFHFGNAGSVALVIAENTMSADPQSPTEQTLRFLSLLFEPTDVVLLRPIETWIEGDKKRSRTIYDWARHHTVGAVNDLLLRSQGRMAQREKANLFFGVCPRAGRDGYDLAWQIRTVRCLWADIDDCTPEVALQRCADAGLPEPSIVISSGNGVHLYWLLAEPYVIDDAGAPPQVMKEWVEGKDKKRPIDYFVDAQGEKVYLQHRETGKPIAAIRPALSPKALLLQDVLKGIASQIGGDHTTDLSRLLRLPGTWNRKDERNGREPVLCEIVQQSDVRYSFEQFAALAEASEDRQKRDKLAQVKLPKARAISASKQDKLDALINRCSLAPAGERSECDFALCCYGVEKGIAKADLWAQVSSIGKFAERGEEYFAMTWASAQEQTRERIYAKAARRSVTRENTAPTTNGKVNATAAPAASHDVPHVDLPEGRTDLANARRFVVMHGDCLRYCHPWSKWLVWDGMRWKMDDNGSAMRLAKSVADAVWQEARDSEGEAALQHAVRTASDRSVKAMLSLAASDLPILPAELDSNPWLLNCPNGTVDLRTGEIREHRREDYITKLCPTEYDPDAPSYSWDCFLEGVFASAPIIDFVQRLCGYALTGDQREQILPILWGEGSNGKSTLLNSLLNAVGPDYAMQAAPDLLMTKRGDTHPTDKADLFGKRIVCCIESDEGRRLSEAFVKSLTGGEKVRARRMREDFWEFNPTHTVFLATNYKPEVKGDDHAIWRRLALIPFVMTFWNPDKGETGKPELKQDKTLPATLEAEAKGILAWAIRGCREWQLGGLRVPEEVRAATTRYQAEEDKIAMFITDECVLGASCKVRGGQLYGAYKQWADGIGEAPMTMAKFGRRIKKRPEISDDRSNGTWYLGIGLRAEPGPLD